MIAYAIVMFIGALLFILLGIPIYRGKTELIHSYHQTNVKDKIGYGKAMGKAVLGLSLPYIASGIVSFLGDSYKLLYISIGVLIIGFIFSFAFIFKVQKKYNGGMF